MLHTAAKSVRLEVSRTPEEDREVSLLQVDGKEDGESIETYPDGTVVKSYYKNGESDHSKEWKIENAPHRTDEEFLDGTL